MTLLIENISLNEVLSEMKNGLLGLAISLCLSNALIPQVITQVALRDLYIQRLSDFPHRVLLHFVDFIWAS